MHVHRTVQDMRTNEGSGYRIFGDDIFGDYGTFEVATDHLIFLKTGRAIKKQPFICFSAFARAEVNAIILYFFLDVSQLATCSVAVVHFFCDVSMRRSVLILVTS